MRRVVYVIEACDVVGFVKNVNRMFAVSGEP